MRTTVLVLSGILATVSIGAAADIPPDQLDFFEKKVKPILVDKCYKCHSAEAGKSKGGLLLDSREACAKGGDTGPAVIPGDVNKSLLLTAVSFFIAGTDLVWQPSIPVAIIVLAIAQMGVHLAFFLHITTGPDNTNNVLALAFGLLIVFLVIGGSLWIMANLNHNMMPMDQLMQMQR